ncbi:MAG: hypothetical protein CL912_06990 [Deltaproteobacteria bacterium]|nr:hypothetical protein [Deltaproteobacteria bacterium]
MRQKASKQTYNSTQLLTAIIIPLAVPTISPFLFVHLVPASQMVRYEASQQLLNYKEGVFYSGGREQGNEVTQVRGRG